MPEENSQEETSFDRISRILATPIPRRTAIGLGAKIIGTAILATLWPSKLFSEPIVSSPGATGNTTISVLKLRVGNFSANKAKVIDIVSDLRNKYGASINFMEHANGPLVSINVKAGTVQDVLHQIRQQDPTYLTKVVHGRFLMYPNIQILNTVIALPVAGKIGRISAAGNLTTYLQKNVKGFEHFGTMFVGSLGSALFQNPVTLSKRGTVLEYLAEMAGDDLGAAFDIPYWSNGWYALNFREVAIWKATIQEDAVPRAILNGSVASIGYNPTRTYNSLDRAKDIEDAFMPEFTQIAYGNPKTGLSRNTTGGTVSPSVSKLFTPGQMQPMASSSDPCRLLSVSYTRGPQVACKDIPGILPGNTCGYIEEWTANSVTYCSGDNCSGKQVTESIQGQGGFGSSNTQCFIEDGGALSNCHDYYGGCGSAPPPPGQPQVGTITQTINVGGGATAISNTITTTITACGKGTITQFQSPAGTQSQCCGHNPPTSGAGSKTLCSSPQTCINGDVCCDPGTLAACNHVCCKPKTASYPGDTCITDSITLKSQCCPMGTLASCNGICCATGQGCVGGVCCSPSQATSDNKTCCPSGQLPQGTICCPTGQTNCGGKCCANVCCNGVCCAAGQTCINGVCCGQPNPQARMPSQETLRGRYATNDLSQCCAPGSPPCGNICCPTGSVCCSGSCCAGTCDSTGACITNGENK